MAQHRTWDESRSPQWKYLLQKESSQRRKTRKDIEIERARKQMEEGAPPKKRIKKGANKKRYVRIEGELKRKISEQHLKTEYKNQVLYDDTNRTTQLSTEPKE